MAAYNNQNNKNKITKKLILVGDGGVGKTTFVKLLRINAFEQRYVATLGVEVHRIRVTRGEKEVCLNCWDTAGQEKFGGLRDGYYIQGDIAIAMFDLTSEITLKHMEKWISDVARILVGVPLFIVGNKTDCQKIPPHRLEEFIEMVKRMNSELRFSSISMHNISVKSGEGVAMLLQNIAQKAITMKSKTKSKTNTPQASAKVQSVEDMANELLASLSSTSSSSSQQSNLPSSHPFWNLRKNTLNAKL